MALIKEEKDQVSEIERKINYRMRLIAKLFNSVFAPISDASRRCNIAEFLFQAEKLRDKSHFLLTEKHFNDRKKYIKYSLLYCPPRGKKQEAVTAAVTVVCWL